MISVNIVVHGLYCTVKLDRVSSWPSISDFASKRRATGPAIEMPAEKRHV
jgi:hypothetical protein